LPDRSRSTASQSTFATSVCAPYGRLATLVSVDAEVTEQAEATVEDLSGGGRKAEDLGRCPWYFDEVSARIDIEGVSLPRTKVHLAELDTLLKLRRRESENGDWLRREPGFEVGEAFADGACPLFRTRHGGGKGLRGAADGQELRAWYDGPPSPSIASQCRRARRPIVRAREHHYGSSTCSVLTIALRSSVMLR